MGKLHNQNCTEYRELQKKIREQGALTWAFMGDSLIAGYTEQEQHYITYFKQRITEEAVDGNQRKKDRVLIEELPALEEGPLVTQRFTQFLTEENVDIVCLMLGLQTSEEMNLEGFKQQLSSLVEGARSRGAIPILQTPNYISLEDKRAATLAQAVEAIQQIAKALDVILIDHYTIWCEMNQSGIDVVKEYLVDTIYPSCDGHLTLAQSLCSYLDIWEETSTICTLNIGKGNTLCK